MHRIVALAGLSLAFLSSTPAFAQMITLTPAQIGEVFCIARLGNDMAPVEGLLTAGLATAIAEAEARNDVIQRAHPDEKPPLGDGIPWQAFPDYADQCKPEVVASGAAEASVAIHYGFTGQPDAGFTDTLMLVLVDDPASSTKARRIDNVGHDTETDLRTILTAAFEN